MIKYEDEILKLVKLLKLEGFNLKRSYYEENNNYLAYTYHGPEISIAICNHHTSWYLDGRICITSYGYVWSDFIINLPIPTNSTQNNFVIYNITKYLADIESFNQITEYDISTLYNLK